MNLRIQSTGKISALSLLAGACLASAPSLGQQADVIEEGAAATTRQSDLDEGFNEGSGALYLRRARDTLIGVRDFAAALDPALDVVAAQENDPDENYTADLLALGQVQAELGQHEVAEANYLKAIDLIEADEGELSIGLVDPYRGLGRAYIKSARYPEAITVLEQAQNISQRHLGLFNVEQAGLLDDITTAYLGLGDTTEARRMQLERLENAVKRFGADDPRVIPFRYQLADYYQRSRMQISAREQYEEVLKSQETQLGATHPGLLGPLRQLVKVDLMMAQGEEDEAYARLVSILQQNSDIDAVERGLSLVVLGDWATVAGDTLGARDYYKQAWDALKSKPDVDAAGFFAQPVMIDFIAPLSAVDRGAQSKPYAWGSIVFEFDLSAEGRPMNVQTLGNEVQASTFVSRYTRRLRETHFRPKIVEGEPVAVSDVQFTHYFRFYVNEEG
jgi:tetratricopeptide (TPR) repeat protein